MECRQEDLGLIGQPVSPSLWDPGSVRDLVSKNKVEPKEDTQCHPSDFCRRAHTHPVHLQQPMHTPEPKQRHTHTYICKYNKSFLTRYCYIGDRLNHWVLGIIRTTLGKQPENIKVSLAHSQTLSSLSTSHISSPLTLLEILTRVARLSAEALEFVFTSTLHMDCQ